MRIPIDELQPGDRVIARLEGSRRWLGPLPGGPRTVRLIRPWREHGVMRGVRIYWVEPVRSSKMISATVVDISPRGSESATSGSLFDHVSDGLGRLTDLVDLLEGTRHIPRRQRCQLEDEQAELIAQLVEADANREAIAIATGMSITGIHQFARHHRSGEWTSEVYAARAAARRTEKDM